MKIYRIRNRITGQWWDGEARSTQEACQKAGWLIGDCWVRQQTHGQYSTGWKNITRRAENNGISSMDTR